MNPEFLAMSDLNVITNLEPDFLVADKLQFYLCRVRPNPYLYPGTQKKAT